MELWDAYDSNLNLLNGKTLVRGEPIPYGIYHLVCAILVKHSDGTYLLMQRDARKNYGKMWEASAEGAALQGESPLDCAIRELKEETGIENENLLELGRIIHHQYHAIYVNYLCETNHDKDNIILQEGETQTYKWVSKETLMNMSKNKLVTNRIQIFIEELQR